MWSAENQVDLLPEIEQNSLTCWINKERKKAAHLRPRHPPRCKSAIRTIAGGYLSGTAAFSSVAKLVDVPWLKSQGQGNSKTAFS